MNDARLSQPKRRAIFLDRDGTLNEEVGYLRTLSDLRFCAGAVEAVRRINAAGWLALVLTNQSGVARGLFTESFVNEAHAAMQQRLQAEGARLDAFYVCPHLPPDERRGEEERGGRGDGAMGRRGEEETLRRYRIACECRKPKPGLLMRAAAEFNIDVAHSFVIGDRYRDVELAHGAGAQGVLVLTGYGQQELAQRAHWPRQPEFITADLLAAVQIIFKQTRASAIRTPQSAIESCAS